MNFGPRGGFSTRLNYSMLISLIVLCALNGVQAKAFPSRHKRYEGGYHYIPYDEGMVHIPAGYSPENLPSYQDYVHGYVQSNGHDWPTYYHEGLLHQPMQHSYSNINGHHKTKPDHNWHFVDHSRIPVSQYTNGEHQFGSDVEVPNVMEALVKNEIMGGHDGEYDVPVVVEALKYDGNAIVTESPSYGVYNHIKEKPIKEKPIKEKPIKEKPIKEKPVQSLNKVHHEHEIPVIESLIGKKHPVHVEDEYDLPVVVEALVRKQIPVHEIEKTNAMTEEYESPVVVEALVRKQLPANGIKPNTMEEYESPVVVETLVRERLTGHEIKKTNTKEDEYESPVVVEALVRKMLPAHEIGKTNAMGEEYESPVVVEALVRKQLPAHEIKKTGMQEEYESPVVVDALVRDQLPVYEVKEKNEMEGKSLHHLPEGSFLNKEGEKLEIPEVVPLNLEQDADDNSIPKREAIALDDTQGFNDPERDSFDENEGSGMDFDRPRSFFPVGSSIFSEGANVKEQERRKFKSCFTPKNESGNCMPFNLCSVSSTVTNIEELLKNVCIIDEVFIGICCPEFPVEKVRVDWEQLKPDVEKLNEDQSPQTSTECGRLPLGITDRDPWPWMASLIAKSSDKIFCGGALIAEQYVLTAAHCTKRIPQNQILVRLGGPAAENRPEPEFEVVEINRHAGYNPRTMQNDIALLKLSRRVHLGDFRRVVCLANDDEGTEALISESASLLHWKGAPGKIKNAESLAVISKEECQNKMRTAIPESILCTEPRTEETMCNADSGAPLILVKDGQFEVIGILTWNRNDCDERFPTVFARVSSYRRWIDKLAS